MVRVVARLFAIAPEWAVKGFVSLLTALFWIFAGGRRRVVLSNLTIAFPEKGEREIRAIGYASVRQSLESWVLALAFAYFGEKRLRRTFAVAPSVVDRVEAEKGRGRAAILIGPHLGPQEGHSLLPLFFPDAPKIGGIFRPLNQPKFDRWIQETRERFGVSLFSRKDGLRRGIDLLKRRGWLGIFFDQNSLSNGVLMTFMGRVASVTDLPAMLAVRYEADVFGFYIARQEFWRYEICGGDRMKERERDRLTFETNRWLEELFRSDESLIPGWLWMHNRWRHCRPPRLSIWGRKNLLEEQNRYLGRSAVPRREPVFLTLPNEREEVVALLPLVEALRRSRPDIALTIISAGEGVEVVERSGLAERVVAWPASRSAERRVVGELRGLYPGLHLLLVRDRRAVKMARKIGAPYRFGIDDRSIGRRDLTDRWRPSEALLRDGGVRMWEAFLQHYGLKQED